ncbi:hypothetical protein [Pseudoneobacillus sp. C159]
MRGILLLFAFLMVLLTGCNSGNVSQPVDNVNNMPIEMPSDFDFIVQFGVGMKNEINSMTDIVTKDLIADGTVTTKITFTPTEMNLIYKRMREMNILAAKKLAPEVDCMQEPHEDDSWEIIIDGQTIHYSISGEYCEQTKDAKQLIDLRNFIFEMVKNKDEYEVLPEARGGYE